MIANSLTLILIIDNFIESMFTRKLKTIDTFNTFISTLILQKTIVVIITCVKGHNGMIHLLKPAL